MESKDINWNVILLFTVRLALILQKMMVFVAQHRPFGLDFGFKIPLILPCGYVWIKPKFDNHGSAHSFAVQIQQVA
jgi:hypothetical protein